MALVNEEITTKTSKGKEQEGYNICNTLKTNIDNYLIKAVKIKHDAVILITGIEGAGKSTLAFQLAKYCDKTFTEEDIVFSGEEFMQKIDESTPGKAIVFDEAVLGMYSADGISKLTNILVKKMVVCRSKRLFIFLVLPSIFLLKRYFAVYRTRNLIHVYCKDGIQRGFYKFYSYDRKRLLYIKGAKYLNMNAEKPNFIGRFPGTEVIDINHYNQIKN